MPETYKYTIGINNNKNIEKDINLDINNNNEQSKILIENKEIKGNIFN